MSTFKMLVAAFLAAPLAFAPAWAGSKDRAEEGGFLAKASQEAKDGYIVGRLNTAYMFSEHLNPFRINVDADNGKVTLTGTVSNEIERDLAIEIAKGVPQVKSVESNLQVDREEQDTAASGKSGFAETFKDASMTARVKTRLIANGNTSGLGINVDTEGQIVTLTGTVDSGAERDLAVQIARNTDGVKRVISKLHVSRS